MTKQEPASTAQARTRAADGELSDAALNWASGGALNAYAPAESAHGSGGGGGTGKPAACDGSVKTNNALIGLL